MNETILVVVYLLLCHFIADFICQSDYMSFNKWESLLALSWHIFVYVTVLAIMLSVLQFKDIGMYLLTNGCLHFITDYFSSKVTHFLWEKKETHWFFVVIGLDQFIHTSFLIIFSSLLVR